MMFSSRAAGAATLALGVLEANCGDAADDRADGPIRSISSLPRDYVNPPASRGTALVADHRSAWRSA